MILQIAIGKITGENMKLKMMKLLLVWFRDLLLKKMLFFWQKLFCPC
ncbi:MAG: hypothetical protein US25_C0086G0003 [Candidatus Moranbacteria bacterium GW2011_GWE1_36_7]|nr:MAG: hypothetical protein US25_C0086G0003 [Candidatus Moranbacteria bacterium GW2011_GWE1_36_7]